MMYDIVSASFGRPGYAMKLSDKNDVRRSRCGLAALFFSANNYWSEITPEQSRKSVRPRLIATVRKGKTRLIVQMGHCFQDGQTVTPALLAKRPVALVEVSGEKTTSADERAELSAILGMDLNGTHTAKPYIGTKPYTPALDRYAQPSRVVSQHPVLRDVTV